MYIQIRSDRLILISTIRGTSASQQLWDTLYILSNIRPHPQSSRTITNHHNRKRPERDVACYEHIILVIPRKTRVSKSGTGEEWDTKIAFSKLRPPIRPVDRVQTEEAR